jgi:hypothetical protein
MQTIKTIIKCAAWAIVMMALALASVYGLYLILIFWLFDEHLYMAMTVAGEFLIFCIYFWMIRAVE